MNGYKNILITLHEREKQEFGEGFLFAGAEHKDLQKLVDRSMQELNITLDKSYLDFLEFTNGLDYDGLVIYGTERYQNGNDFQEGFVEANAEFRKDPELQHYICYGDENSTRQVFNLKTSRFESIDRVAWDDISQHDTFDDMLLTAIHKLDS